MSNQKSELLEKRERLLKELKPELNYINCKAEWEMCPETSNYKLRIFNYATDFPELKFPFIVEFSSIIDGDVYIMRISDRDGKVNYRQSFYSTVKLEYVAVSIISFMKSTKSSF